MENNTDLNIYFSASVIGFYPYNDKWMYDRAGSWPDDATPITMEEYEKYNQQPPDGYVLAGDENGHPVWIDAPPPPHEYFVQLANNDRFKRLTDARAEMLKIFMADSLASDDTQVRERAELWRDYVDVLNELDTDKAPDIEWPKAPKS